MAKPAAIFGSVELQVVTQHIEQRRIRIGVDLVRGSVDLQSYHVVTRLVGLAGARRHAIGGETLAGRVRSADLRHHAPRIRPSRLVAECGAEIAKQRRQLVIVQRTGEAGHDRASLALGGRAGHEG